MRRVKIFLSAMAFAGLSFGTAAQSPGGTPESVNTTEDKIYALSLLWSEIKYNFVHIDRLDFDVDSLYRETMRRVLATDNDVDFYKELDRFLVAFGDGHTQLLDMPDSGWEDTDYPRYGTRLFGDKFHFTSYRLNSDTDPRLLGAEIVEIEGKPAMEYVLQNVLPSVTGSTKHYRMQWAGSMLLNGPTGTWIEGKAKRPDGEIIPFRVIRDGETTRTPDEVYWKPPHQRPPRRDFVWHEWNGKIAVMTVNRFWPMTVADQIDSVMTCIKAGRPEGLIIDLRNNGGGATDVAWRLQMHLTDADSIWNFAAQTRTNLGYGRAQGNYREEYEDYFKYRSYETFPAEKVARDTSIEPITCPVVVLIGTFCFSACEDFLVNIYEMPDRPLLVGEETGGSSGAPLVIYLPHGATARICTLRELFPRSLEPFGAGHGIEPDIEVKQTIEEYLAGVDPVMQKALEILRDEPAS